MGSGKRAEMGVCTVCGCGVTLMLGEASALARNGDVRDWDAGLPGDKILCSVCANLIRWYVKKIQEFAHRLADHFERTVIPTALGRAIGEEIVRLARLYPDLPTAAQTTTGEK